MWKVYILFEWQNCEKNCEINGILIYYTLELMNYTLLSINKIMDTVFDLPSDTLKKIYLGQKRGRLLVLNFKRISFNLFRFQMRDLVFNDHFVCQKVVNFTIWP